MAHELEFLNGEAQAAYAFEPAWHNLGIVLPRYITSREALELVPALASDVVLEPVKRHGIEVPNRNFTVRADDDKVLGVVGDRYRVLQNSEALDLLDSLVAGGEAHYESLLSLKGGAQVALVVALEGLGIKVGGVDQVKSYLLLSNSHDGSTAARAAVTPVRVVCNNTLQYALGSTKLIHSVRHSRNMLDRLAEVKEVLSMTQDYMTEFERDATTLMHTPMNDSEWEQFLGKLIVIPEEKEMGKTKSGQPKSDRGRTIAMGKHEEITAIWKNLEQTAAEDYSGTRWGALQAVSHYNQRLATVRAKGLDENAHDYEALREQKQAENRFTRTLSGGVNLTEEAHDLLAVAA